MAIWDPTEVKFRKETGTKAPKSGSLNKSSQLAYANALRIWKSGSAARATAASTPTSSATPSGSTSLYSKDAKIAVGQKVGQDRFKQYYGQDAGQTGEMSQEAKTMVRDRALGTDARSGQQQNSMSRSLRRLKSQGATDQQVESQSRQNNLDYSAASYNRQGSALNDYRRLIGNFINGGQSLEMGFAGLEKSGQQIQQPRYQSGGITVICTELHRQGLMSDEVYEKDAEYGRYMFKNHIFIMIGYMLWATKVVYLMKKSKLFTRIISVPALAWADKMAGKNNLLGTIIKSVGEPICDILGKIYVWRKKCITERVN